MVRCASWILRRRWPRTRPGTGILSSSRSEALLQALDDVPSKGRLRLVVRRHTKFADLEREACVAESGNHAVASVLAGRRSHAVVRHRVDPGRGIVGVLLDEAVKVLALLRP